MGKGSLPGFTGETSLSKTSELFCGPASGGSAVGLVTPSARISPGSIKHAICVAACSVAQAACTAACVEAGPLAVVCAGACTALGSECRAGC